MATSMDLIKPLVTLVAIVNPLGIVPFFIHYTQGYTHAQRMRTAKVSAISAFFVISISALIGQQLLGFFGISIASFQVGGGLLLLISSSLPRNASLPVALLLNSILLITSASSGSLKWNSNRCVQADSNRA